MLLRLRRGVGDVVVRFGSGVRLAQGVTCDLFEFERLANDALASARTDPEIAGQLAAQAVALVEGAGARAISSTRSGRCPPGGRSTTG